jgi:hypothetical protein
MAFAPFTDEQLWALEQRFERIYRHTPDPRPRSPWAPASAPAPEPAYQVVFRPCVPGEWNNIMGQVNHAKESMVAGGPKNLSLATIVAVSFEGKQTIVDLDNPDLRMAQRPVRDAFEKLLAKWTGVPEAVMGALGELNGVVKDAQEKG